MALLRTQGGNVFVTQNARFLATDDHQLIVDQESSIGAMELYVPFERNVVMIPPESSIVLVAAQRMTTGARSEILVTSVPWGQR